MVRQVRNDIIDREGGHLTMQSPICTPYIHTYGYYYIERPAFCRTEKPPQLSFDAK